MFNEIEYQKTELLLVLLKSVVEDYPDTTKLFHERINIRNTIIIEINRRINIDNQIKE